MMKETGNTDYLRKLDRKHIWHPFTQMQDWRRMDFLVIEKGRGPYLYDTDGNRYLDGISSLWVNVHGHGKRELDRAVKKQLALVAHSTFLGLTNVPAIHLAKELIEIAPSGLSRVFYSDNGSTAVEVALKMAFQYWQFQGKNKTSFVTFTNAYHGDTIGSVSLGGIDLFHRLFEPLLFPTSRTHSPYCYRCPIEMSYPACRLACLNRLDQLLMEKKDEIAAVILEPEIQGAAGMITQPPGFVRGVREICDRYETLLIFDEVATGFGRTGKMFAAELSGVTPDLMAIAKGITGGYLPLAATLATEKIFDAFLGKYEELKTFFHGHTYTANPLACAAARENIRLLRQDTFQKHLDELANLLEAELPRFQEIDIVGEVRQKGLMVGIELVADKTTRTEIPLPEQAGHQVILKARQMGAILRPLGNVIILMPPLTITSKQLKKLLNITFQSIINYQKERL